MLSAPTHTPVWHYRSPPSSLTTSVVTPRLGRCVWGSHSRQINGGKDELAMVALPKSETSIHSQ